MHKKFLKFLSRFATAPLIVKFGSIGCPLLPFSLFVGIVIKQKYVADRQSENKLAISSVKFCFNDCIVSTSGTFIHKETTSKLTNLSFSSTNKLLTWEMKCVESLT